MQDWTPRQLQEAIESDGAVFLKLWKKGCGACKLSIPALERIEPEHPDMQFGQILTDDHPDILELSESESLPAFFVFKNRKMLGKSIGFKGLEKLKAFVDEALNCAK